MARVASGRVTRGRGGQAVTRVARGRVVGEALCPDLLVIDSGARLVNSQSQGQAKG